MFLNPNEGKIISKFCANYNHLSGKSLLLEWNSGSICAKFDTCFEDIDDETEEEYYSFLFIASSADGKPPVVINEDNYFLVNYKNFPNSITLDSVKLN